GSKPSKKKTKVAVSKRLRKATLEGTSERAPCGKGKGPAEATESPDRAPTLRDLCEVDDRAGKDRYFVAQISELPRLVAEGPLKPRWPNLTNSTRVWTERPIAAEYVRGALHPSLAKQLYESPFEELMDQAAKSAVWASAGSEAMAAAKKRAIKLSAEVDRLMAALGKTKQCRKGLELAADSTRVELKDLRDSRRWLEDEVLLLTKAAGCCSPS
ncbi:hypothetical protein BHM03_00051290, partial [Ensete ventricosum]